MRFTIFTLFPEYFDSILRTSILGKAISQRLIEVDFICLREFGFGKHRSVDDRPFGGGEGMVLQAEVFEKAFVALLKSQDALSALEQSVSSFRLTGVFQPQDQLPFVIHLSPQGRVLNSVFAKKLSCGFNHLVLLCGHYEGIDERVIESFVHQEVSVGDYVLTGGEPAAAIFIDCLSRFVDQVVGDAQSVSNDTFELTNEALRDEHLPGLLKHPVYTRPQSWRGRDVPAVLLSGDHKKIEKWRKTKQLERTQSKRPDLIKK